MHGGPPRDHHKRAIHQGQGDFTVPLAGCLFAVSWLCGLCRSSKTSATSIAERPSQVTGSRQSRLGVALPHACPCAYFVGVRNRGRFFQLPVDAVCHWYSPLSMATSSSLELLIYHLLCLFLPEARLVHLVISLQNLQREGGREGEEKGEKEMRKTRSDSMQSIDVVVLLPRPASRETCSHSGRCMPSRPRLVPHPSQPHVPRTGYIRNTPIACQAPVCTYCNPSHS